MLVCILTPEGKTKCPCKHDAGAHAPMQAVCRLPQAILQLPCRTLTRSQRSCLRLVKGRSVDAAPGEHAWVPSDRLSFQAC